MKYITCLLFLLASSLASLAESVRMDIFGGGEIILQPFYGSYVGYAYISGSSGWDHQLISSTFNFGHEQVTVNVGEWNYVSTSSIDASSIFASASAPSGYHIEVLSDTSGSTGNTAENSNLAGADCHFWYRVLAN